MTGGLQPLSTLSITGGSLLERLMIVNITLVLFNLIPAFPMDGGRVVRSLLALRLDYGRATQIAATLGQGIALLLGLIGLFTNPFLVFTALFVWIGAAQESGMAQVKSALAGIPLHRAMITDYRSLAPEDTLGRAVDLVLSGTQQDFPVVSAGRVAGILTRADLLIALRQRGDRIVVAVGRAVGRAVAGQEAVLSALGPRGGQYGVLPGGVRNIVAAMSQAGVKRLIHVSSFGVGDSREQMGWVARAIFVPLFLRKALDEKEIEEGIIRASDLDWIIARPGGLEDGPRPAGPEMPR